MVVCRPSTLVSALLPHSQHPTSHSPFFDLLQRVLHLFPPCASRPPAQGTVSLFLSLFLPRCPFQSSPTPLSSVLSRLLSRVSRLLAFLSLIFAVSIFSLSRGRARFSTTHSTAHARTFSQGGLAKIVADANDALASGIARFFLIYRRDPCTPLPRPQRKALARDRTRVRFVRESAKLWQNPFWYR